MDLGKLPVRISIDRVKKAAIARKLDRRLDFDLKFPRLSPRSILEIYSMMMMLQKQKTAFFAVQIKRNEINRYQFVSTLWRTLEGCRKKITHLHFRLRCNYATQTNVKFKYYRRYINVYSNSETIYFALLTVIGNSRDVRTKSTRKKNLETSSFSVSRKTNVYFSLSRNVTISHLSSYPDKT